MVDYTLNWLEKKGSEYFRLCDPGFYTIELEALMILLLSQ